MGKPCEFFFKSSVQTNGLHRLLGVLGDDDEMDALCGYMLKNRAANGVRQTYEYDGRGQLLAVKNEDGSDAERYAYDAAGRLVKEGNKRYTYGYLDKVMSVADGDTTRTFTYHADGQLATASYSGDGRALSPRAPQTETFLWDGLALVKRVSERFINEPHVGNAPKKLCFEGKPRAQRSARRARKGPRGNPVVSSKGTSYFNDMLGTTVGAKVKGKYSAAALTAFGEDLSVETNGGSSSHSTLSTLNSQFFTGKPHVPGLGHAFLFRNYRAGLAKWQTADPMGYPDGWNQLAYCNNGVTSAVDLWGCERNVGDIEYIDMNPDEYFALLGLGGKALPLEREGFDSEWLGAGRSHIEIQGSRHSAVANGIETTWAMFADYENFARWSVYFVSVEFTAENFRSRLCSLAASGGKITDAICKVLLVFGVLASVEVKVGAKISSIIGSLEDLMKDRVTIELGRYKVCDELYESCCRKYEEIVSVAFIKE